MQEELTGQEIYENNLINRWVEKYLKAKEELEEYKKSKQASYEALQARCNELELSNRKLKQECEWFKKDAGFWAYKAGLAMVSASRCKHALDEIEEIISTIMETNKIYPLQANLGKILYIIQDSKAKGNENDR